MAINIKQVKGSENIIAQAAFVQENLNGKIAYENGSLVLSVPFRTISGASTGDDDDPDSPSQPTDGNSFVVKKYVDDQIDSVKGTATAQGDTLGELESAIATIKNSLTNQKVTVSAEQTTGTKIGTITVGSDTVEFRINLSSYAPLNSPSFSGAPTTTTPATNSDSTQLATTAFVQRIKESLLGTVSSTLNTLQKISAAINNDPNYYQTITTALGTKLNSDDISVTGSSGEGTLIGTISLGSNSYDFKVNLSPYALLNSPALTGTPTAPTAAQGVNTTQIATTAFVNTAINDLKGSDLSTSLNTLKKIATSINNDATFSTTVNTALSGKQPLHAALISISGLTTAANKMIYTTAANTYAVANLTATARSLLDDSTVADMRNTLDVPKKDGTGATGTWDITVTSATNATSATSATNDSNGDKISTTYLKIQDHKDPDLSAYAKTADIKQVSVTNTLSTGTRLGTITVGTVAKDINVNLAPYAPLASPTFTGTPTAPTVEDQDDDSTKVATTAFVAEAIRRLVGTSPEGLDTLQELAAAINNEPNFASALAEQLIGKQPLHAALTSISGLTTSANQMIYTTAANTYATATLSAFARTILDDTSAATVRNTIGALGKSENAVSATSATTAAACTGNSATATNATNDADGNLISTTYVKVGNLHNLTAANNLGWTDQTAGKKVTPSLNSLAYWNGRYNSSASNLAYCNKGAFGDIITHSASDFLTQSQADAIYKNIDYAPDLSSYLTKASAATTYLGISAKAADATKADSATTAASCTGNAATATTLKTARNIGIKDADSTNTGTGANFNGSGAITLKLPSTIKATLTGNADTATKLKTARSINIQDSDGTNSGTKIDFDGSSTAVQYIKLPATIKATLTGNASTATSLQTAQTIKIANSDGTSATTGTSFNGTAGITLNLPKTIKASLSGTATSAQALTTSATFDGVTYKGATNVSHYAVCSTAAATAAKTVTIADVLGYTLATGSRVTIKFSNTNTAANPTLSVNGTTAKYIYYRGYAVPAAALQANATYDLVYNGTQWDIIGSILWAE